MYIKRNVIKQMRLEKQRSVYVGSYRLDEESLELTFNKKPMENFKQEIL